MKYALILLPAAEGSDAEERQVVKFPVTPLRRAPRRRTPAQRSRRRLWLKLKEPRWQRRPLRHRLRLGR